MFLDSLHSMGKLVSGDTPLPSGPRHCDQLLLGAASEATVAVVITRRQMHNFEDDSGGIRFIVQLTPGET
jgi:hypothetical protein